MAQPSGEGTVRQSLLDRLIDERVDPTQSSRQAQSARVLRESVRRDLEDLFNSKRQWQTWPDAWEELNESLVNYGLPDFSGVVYAGPQSQGALQRILEETIERFEPRLSDVQVEFQKRRRSQTRKLMFKVRAVLRMDPWTEPVAFESDVEPGSGAIRIRETPT
ncbi:MAG: type VI secretion system baseplate subunit TssE [Planctomyces sp.]|nr:type VI secretion system baseplate subunit TssE [Planctomyces sp.]